MLKYTEEQMNTMLAEESEATARHRMILEANIDCMKLVNESDNIDTMVSRLDEADWQACSELQVCGEVI